jgi:hypothetical protein
LSELVPRVVIRLNQPLQKTECESMNFEKC